jgi:hypothetical protein
MKRKRIEESIILNVPNLPHLRGYRWQGAHAGLSARDARGRDGLVLRNLDAKDRGSIHPAKGLEIAAVVENCHVLGNAKFYGFRHRLIHHFLR